VKRWILAAVAAAVVVALAGIPIYVLPATDEPGTVDVVYVIGPPTDARIELALDMAGAGQTDAVMVSLDPEEAVDYPAAAGLCEGGEDAGIDVLCAKPDPFTTRGEARELEAQMASHGWDQAAVITITPHISRAHMIMDRCDVGDLSMIDSGESLDPWYWVYHYAYQSAGYAKAFVLQGC